MKNKPLLIWAVALFAILLIAIVLGASLTFSDQEKYAKTAKLAEEVAFEELWLVMDKTYIPVSGTAGQYTLILTIAKTLNERIELEVFYEHPNFPDFRLLIAPELVHFTLRKGVKSTNLADHLIPPQKRFQLGKTM